MSVVLQGGLGPPFALTFLLVWVRRSRSERECCLQKLSHGNHICLSSNQRYLLIRIQHFSLRTINVGVAVFWCTCGKHQFRATVMVKISKSGKNEVCQSRRVAPPVVNSACSYSCTLWSFSALIGNAFRPLAWNRIHAGKTIQYWCITWWTCMKRHCIYPVLCGQLSNRWRSDRSWWCRDGAWEAGGIEYISCFNFCLLSAANIEWSLSDEGMAYMLCYNNWQ